VTRILVTGASGQVGSALTHALIDRGHTVRVLLRERAWHPLLDTVPADQLEVVRGNLLNAHDVRQAVKGCQQVFHVAGSISYLPQDRWQMQQVNVNATELVLQAALDAGVEKLVHTSSTAAIGYRPTPHPLSESDALTVALKSVGYLYTKALAEERVRAAVKKGLLACMVNPSTILGAGDIKGNSANLLSQVDSGRVVSPPGGTAVVSVDRVVEGHLLAMEQLNAEMAGARYILSSFNWSYAQLFQSLAQVRGKSIHTAVLPRWSRPLLQSAAQVASLLKPDLGLSKAVIDFSFAYRYYASDKAQEILGWYPDTPEQMQQALKAAFVFYDELQQKS
jgi:dihydroflavonol-4-reductase